MILTALSNYYRRLTQDPDTRDSVPPFGFSREKISWSLVLTPEGELVEVKDERTQTVNAKGKTKLVRTEIIVPTTTRTASRSGKNPPPNFLWDNTKYVLGAAKKPGDSKKYFQRFLRHNEEIGGEIDDVGMQAVLSFLRNWDFSEMENWENLKEILGTNLVFKLVGEPGFIHQRPRIVERWLEFCEEDEARFNRTHKGEGDPVFGTCLILGEKAQIARVHRQIRNFPGGQPSGNAIISFNENAFESYGRDQSFNAPVSIRGAFEYTTALNYLLASDQKKLIGDMTLLFWAERKTPAEKLFGVLINPGNREEIDTETTRRLKDFFSAAARGELPAEIKPDAGVRFFVLGLAPSAARISVVLWYVSTVEEISKNLHRHFEDISIVKGHKDHRDYLGVWEIIRETMPKSRDKSKNSPSPALTSKLTESAITGKEYPRSLLGVLMERIRVDSEVNYPRAAMIKGILIRNHKKEVKMSLDPQNTQVPYLLGRLFAVLEAAQKDAGNETIRERYFGAAAATPRRVFPLLLSLTQHHIAKGDFGYRYDRLTAQIMDMLPAQQFPAHLPLEQQGLFALGYYHQRNDLYRGKEDKNEEKSEE